MATGVTEIDNQHKRIFDLADELVSARKRDEGPEMVTKAATFLGYYVIKHFEAEEKLLEETNYPWREAHTEKHQRFLAEVADLKLRMDVDGPTLELTGKIRGLVVTWLMEHIEKEDKAFVDYMGETGQASRTASPQDPGRSCL